MNQIVDFINKDQIVVLIILTAVAYLFGWWRGRVSVQKNEGATRREYQEAVSRQHLRQVEAELARVNEQNSRYLSFILNISGIVKQLYSTVNLDDLLERLEKLTKNLLSTSTVRIYLLERNEGVLVEYKKGREVGRCNVGDCLIGRAAKSGLIQTRSYNGSTINSDGPNCPDRDLMMAVPVLCKGQLFGVIGLGRQTTQTGNEKSLIKLIADIAGFALMNQNRLREWKNEATTDPLTGLYNRRYFYHRAREAAERSIREDMPVSFFIFDIDNFKHYNDRNGHPAGDTLLAEMSKLVQKVTRKSSLIARFGGEEFIVMLPGIPKKDALIYAERVRQEIEGHPFPFREAQPLGCISISGGVATFPEDGDSINRVISRADKALYRAKEAGRNRVFLYEPDKEPYQPNTLPSGEVLQKT